MLINFILFQENGKNSFEKYFKYSTFLSVVLLCNTKTNRKNNNKQKNKETQKFSFATLQPTSIIEKNLYQ